MGKNDNDKTGELKGAWEKKISLDGINSYWVFHLSYDLFDVNRRNDVKEKHEDKRNSIRSKERMRSERKRREKNED